MDTIKTLTVGTVGVTGVEVANHVDLTALAPPENSISLIIQIIIAVTTLFRMFKKPKGVQ